MTILILHNWNKRDLLKTNVHFRENRHNFAVVRFCYISKVQSSNVLKKKKKNRRASKVWGNVNWFDCWTVIVGRFCGLHSFQYNPASLQSTSVHYSIDHKKNTYLGWQCFIVVCLGENFPHFLSWRHWAPEHEVRGNSSSEKQPSSVFKLFHSQPKQMFQLHMSLWWVSHKNAFC